MLGQLIAFPSKDKPGIIFGCDEKVYYFTDETSNSKVFLDIGIDVNFSKVENNSNLKNKNIKNLVKIESSDGKKLHETIDDVLVTSQSDPENIQVIETIKTLKAFSESNSKEQALKELVNLAKSSNANAILNVKLCILFNEKKESLLYRYSGALATIIHADNSTSNIKPITINHKLIHKNSPNEIRKFYLQLVMVIFILLFLPLWGQIILDYSRVIARSISIPIGVFIAISAFIIFINLDPRSNCHYFKNN